MFTIKNYDSRLKLSNYQLGDIYTFFIHNPNMKNLKKVDKKDFEMYIQSLNNTIENTKNIIKNNDHFLNFTKSIGIVVDKHKSIYPNNIDYITVIFKTPTNDYILNKYIVNSNDILINQSQILFQRQ